MRPLRILVVGPLPRIGAPNHLPWLRYTTSALKSLGHAVETAVYRESWAESAAIGARLIAIPGAKPVVDRYVGRANDRRDRQPLARARAFRPELTIVLKGDVYSPAVFQELKRLTDGPLVSWWVDDPFAYPHSVQALPVFDRVFVFDRSYMPELAARGVTRTTFLPCACDESVYRPIALAEGERRRLGTDVAFIASHYPGRGTLVRALAERMDVGVWGKGWELPMAQAELGATRPLRGGIVSDRVAARIYNATKIGLNLHHPQSRLGGLNTRTFELLACGALPLVDHLPGMEELLEPGREVAVYRTPADAAGVAEEYLGDAAKRKSLVERGRARVLAEHTYVARMRTIEQVMFGSTCTAAAGTASP